MALDTITTCLIEVLLQWNVAKTRAGLQPVTNSDQQRRQVSFGKGVGADMVNDLAVFIQSIAGGATANIDLSAALTNVVNDLNVAAARVKFFYARLLNATDADQDGNLIGTAASSVTIGNATNPWLFTTAGPDTVTLGNGDFIALTRRDATGLVVTPATADTLKIVNNDGALAAKVLLAFGLADA